jgi:hypothetical protein
MADSLGPLLPPNYTAPNVQGTRGELLLISSCKPTGSSPVERCAPGSAPSAECLAGYDPKTEDA